MFPPLHAPGPALIRRFAEITGAAHALTEPADQVAYLHEWRDLYVGRTPLVLRPGSVTEVSRILMLANDERIGIVPQGGNTGLSGGQIPHAGGTEIVVSLSRLNGVRSVDAEGGAMTLEAGLTLAEAKSIAENAGRLFPLSLASEGSCQIGGALATNAGGVAVLAHGNARHLALGLEVVLADGEIWNGLRALKKDNTGYDLRDLFIGSEGTLGIITAATLKLLPRPAGTATALVALADPHGIARLFRMAEEHLGGMLTAFEFWPQIAMRFALEFLQGARDPLAERHPWYVLLEVASSESGARATLQIEQLLASAVEGGVAQDAALAASLQQSRAFWRLRESLSEAQKPQGGSIKHDISVPVARIPSFLARAGQVVETVCPEARPVPFGHFGDGNIHYNVSQPPEMDRAAFLALWPRMNEAVYALVAEMNGSISAEHGIGQLKRAELVRHKSPVELRLMRAIKKALDPNGIMNPGKVL